MKDSFAEVDFTGVTREQLGRMNLNMRIVVAEGEKCSTCGQSDFAMKALSFYYKLVDGVVQTLPTKWKQFLHDYLRALGGFCIGIAFGIIFREEVHNLLFNLW